MLLQNGSLYHRIISHNINPLQLRLPGQAPDQVAQGKNMNHKFIIKGRLPGLNDYLAAERNFSKKHSCGNDMKQQNQMLISNAIRLQLKRLHIDKQVHISYAFYEPDKKRDLDNIAGVAHKFIQDALVKCKVIDNDGWNNISGFDDSFFVDRHNPRIEVTIREVES